MGNGSNVGFVFRDYQLSTIATVFDDFGLEPAGPEDCQIVAACRGNGARENVDDGRNSGILANGSSHDDEPPF